MELAAGRNSQKIYRKNQKHLIVAGIISKPAQGSPKVRGRPIKSEAHLSLQWQQFSLFAKGLEVGDLGFFVGFGGAADRRSVDRIGIPANIHWQS